MKCSLNGNNARVLAKAIQSLAKFGTDLFLEVNDRELQLRSLNQTQSAVGTIKFSRTFFENYNVQAGEESYCKLAMKATLNVFRSMKNVERCELHIMETEGKFQVQLKCRLETVKNFLIAIIDEENMTADVSPDAASNVIIGSHKIFSDISSNFNVAEEEITIEANNRFMFVKNYVEGSRVNDKFMRSKLKLSPAEFESYTIDREASVTFCLKEFRAFLHFAEALNEFLVLNFDQPGSPLFIKIDKHSDVECMLIMSTLALEDCSFSESCQETEVSNTRSESRATRKRKNKTVHKENASKRVAESSMVSTDSSLFQFRDEGASNTNANGTNTINMPPPLAASAVGTPNEPSNVVANGAIDSNPVSVTFCETEDAQEITPGGCDEDEVPQSPPTANAGVPLRLIFSRCFESTYMPKEPSPNSLVYAANSDTEND